MKNLYLFKNHIQSGTDKLNNSFGKNSQRTGNPGLSEIVNKIFVIKCEFLNVLNFIENLFVLLLTL